jgi:ATP-dependent exoDNAse (exonuclease V) alpha subunit
LLFELERKRWWSASAGSGNGVDVIEALAGTGKTYTAGVLAALYEQAGYTVVGVAPTARAARELADQAAIPSRTLDSRVLAINAGRELPPRTVVVFDEAGMASTRLSEQLLAVTACRARPLSRRSSLRARTISRAAGPTRRSPVPAVTPDYS